MRHCISTREGAPQSGMLRTAAALLLMVAMTATAATPHRLTVDGRRATATIAPTMYGVFFEDINFGADGGLYADMVVNRSFEYPQPLQGWTATGQVAIDTAGAAFERNPHYVRMSAPVHKARLTCLENGGFFGMGVKAGAAYELSLYARSGGEGRLRVELAGAGNAVCAKAEVEVAGRSWQRYVVTLTPTVTDARAHLRLTLTSAAAVEVDHVSLFPADAWHGLRRDLVEALEELKPGVLRFPGGCIVEGTDLQGRYEWKHSVGPVENRPLQENRWSFCAKGRTFPHYYQSYGLGFYEFFLLAEHLGAEPLPVLSCGLACQYQNSDDDPHAHCAVADLQPFIDDALDLIEFANGDASTPWGRLRVEMGHPAPFGLKLVGIGNEQWGPLYAERLAPFVQQIRAKHPDIKVVGSAGPKPDGDRFDEGWREMRRLKVDLVDEHYYRPVDFFLQGATRYDNYDRKGPKVFAGEYACHRKHNGDVAPEAFNSFESALAEAAFMTGLERNADVVEMATYAPLFAHTDGWQWRPDLIWFDNLSVVRTPNYYVQQLFACHAGTHVLPISEGGAAVTGQDSLYATACADRTRGLCIVKVVNTSHAPQELEITLRGVRHAGRCRVTTLSCANDDAINTVDDPRRVVPREAEVEVAGHVLRATMEPRAFSVFVVGE